MNTNNHHVAESNNFHSILLNISVWFRVMNSLFLEIFLSLVYGISHLIAFALITVDFSLLLKAHLFCVNSWRQSYSTIFVPAIFSLSLCYQSRWDPFPWFQLPIYLYLSSVYIQSDLLPSSKPNFPCVFFKGCIWIAEKSLNSRSTETSYSLSFPNRILSQESLFE